MRDILLLLIKERGDCMRIDRLSDCVECPLRDMDRCLADQGKVWDNAMLGRIYEGAVNDYIRRYGRDINLMEVLI